MTPTELRKLISQEEGLKLDFKREYLLQPEPPEGIEPSEWKKALAIKWNEFIKDILSLTNGNYGTVNQTGYLIIGVDDKLEPNGTRKLYDTDYLKLSRQQILDRVNSHCYPQIRDVECEHVELDGNNIFVISIPYSPYVQETTKPLNTTKWFFNKDKKFEEGKKKTTYSEHTTFIRRGESIKPATNNEIRKLELEKQSLLNSSTNGMQFNPSIHIEIDNQNSNVQKTGRKSTRSNTKKSELTPKAQVQEELKILILGALTDKYTAFKFWLIILGILVATSILLLLSELNDLSMAIAALFTIVLCFVWAYFFIYYSSWRDAVKNAGFYQKIKIVKSRKIMKEDLDRIARTESKFSDEAFYKYLYLPIFLPRLLWPWKR